MASFLKVISSSAKKGSFDQMGPIYVGDHNELTDPQNELVTRLQECCEVGLLWALVWSELTFGVMYRSRN